MPDPINNERFRKLLLSVPTKAIEFLYDSYYHLLIGVSKRLTKNHDASVDIVQETLIHVWDRRSELGQYHDQSIQHYLVRVVRNKSISFFKSNIKVEEGLRHLNGKHRQNSESPIEMKIIEQEVQSEIRQLITSFPKREKECLLMRIDDDMTTAEIAVVLNVSVKAVERSLTSANKRLRQSWAARNGS